MIAERQRWEAARWRGLGLEAITEGARGGVQSDAGHLSSAGPGAGATVQSVLGPPASYQR